MRVLVALVLFSTLGCGNKSSEGLPPAESWQASAGEVSPFDQPPRPGTGNATRDFDDPHRGVPGAPPLGPDDVDDGAGFAGGDPHAGVPGAPPINPHQGVPGAPMVDQAHASGGVDVTKLGLPPPDPNRRIDPNRRVTGTLKASPQTRARLKPNGTVFLVVKKADATGAPSGPPVAVEKLTWDKDDLAFTLTEEDAMVGGTDLAGDVVVIARYDQDADAGTREPGDVVGQTRVTIPADKVTIVLDTILP
jgi:hypothetical protein